MRTCAQRAAPADSAARIDLGRALRLLPAGYRTAIVLHDIEDWTHAEIGALGIEVGTSKSQLARARQALRALWRVAPTEEDSHAS